MYKNELNLKPSRVKVLCPSGAPEGGGGREPQTGRCALLKSFLAINISANIPAHGLLS